MWFIRRVNYMKEPAGLTGPALCQLLSSSLCHRAGGLGLWWSPHLAGGLVTAPGLRGLREDIRSECDPRCKPRSIMENFLEAAALECSLESRGTYAGVGWG